MTPLLFTARPFIILEAFCSRWPHLKGWWWGTELWRKYTSLVRGQASIYGSRRNEESFHPDEKLDGLIICRVEIGGGDKKKVTFVSRFFLLIYNLLENNGFRLHFLNERLLDKKFLAATYEDSGSIWLMSSNGKTIFFEHSFLPWDAWVLLQHLGWKK